MTASECEIIQIEKLKNNDIMGRYREWITLIAWVRVACPDHFPPKTSCILWTKFLQTLSAYKKISAATLTCPHESMTLALFKINYCMYTQRWTTVQGRLKDLHLKIKEKTLRNLWCSI